MAKKTVLAILLIFMGVSAGWLIIYTYLMSGGATAYALPFLVIAVICIIAGMIIGFSRLLDRQVNPIMDVLQKDLEDDIQDLHERRMTNPIWMLLITIVAAAVFSFFVFSLHKVEAKWGQFPVIIPTFAAMGVLAWFILKTLWFKRPDWLTPMGIFLIPAVGFVLTLVFGLSRTEDLSQINLLRQDPGQIRSPGLVAEDALAVGTRLGSYVTYLDAPSCSDEQCTVYLVIALIILTLVLVIGAAIIPHFWLLSGSIFLMIMLLITIHDLRFRRSASQFTENIYPAP